MAAKLTDSTRRSYAAGWDGWALWCRVRGRSPYLSGQNREERMADEDELLRFITFHHAAYGRKASTLRQKLFAIRYAHGLAGYGDPTEGKRRVWTALEGFRRWDGGVKRKYPVTPRMLWWLQDHLFSEEGGDAVVIWAAVMTAYFFMLRASEYLLRPGAAWSYERVVRGIDVCGFRDGEAREWLGDCDEVALTVTSSKTDQHFNGCVRNHFRSGERLCVVEALAMLQCELPQRFGKGEEAEQPLFRYRDGRHLSREQVQAYLSMAAMAEGIDPGRMGSHSLRIGGATALYHSVRDLEAVKRFGRWTTDCYHIYLHEDHERQRGFAKGMSQGSLLLTQTAGKQDIVGEPSYGGIDQASWGWAKRATSRDGGRDDRGPGR